MEFNFFGPCAFSPRKFAFSDIFGELRLGTLVKKKHVTGKTFPVEDENWGGGGGARIVETLNIFTASAE